MTTPVPSPGGGAAPSNGVPSIQLKRKTEIQVSRLANGRTRVTQQDLTNRRSIYDVTFQRGVRDASFAPGTGAVSLRLNDGRQATIGKLQGVQGRLRVNRPGTQDGTFIVYAQPGAPGKPDEVRVNQFEHTAEGRVQQTKRAERFNTQNQQEAAQALHTTLQPGNASGKTLQQLGIPLSVARQSLPQGPTQAPPAEAVGRGSSGTASRANPSMFFPNTSGGTSQSQPQPSSNTDTPSQRHPDIDRPWVEAGARSYVRGMGRFFTDAARDLSKPENLVKLGLGAAGLGLLAAVSAPAAAVVAGGLTILGGVGAGISLGKNVAGAVTAAQRGEAGKEDFLNSMEGAGKSTVDLGFNLLATRGITQLAGRRSVVSAERRLAQVGDEITSLNKRLASGNAAATPQSQQRLSNLIQEQAILGDRVKAFRNADDLTKWQKERDLLGNQEQQLKLLDDRLATLPDTSPARTSLETTRGSLLSQVEASRARVAQLQTRMGEIAADNVGRVRTTLQPLQQQLRQPGPLGYGRTTSPAAVNAAEAQYRQLQPLLERGQYIDAQWRRTSRQIETLQQRLDLTQHPVTRQDLQTRLQQLHGEQRQLAALQHQYHQTLDLADDVSLARLAGTGLGARGRLLGAEHQFNTARTRLDQATAQVMRQRAEAMRAAGQTPTEAQAIRAYRHYLHQEHRLQRSRELNDPALPYVEARTQAAQERYFDLSSDLTLRQAALDAATRRTVESQRRLENAQQLVQGQPLRHPAVPPELGVADVALSFTSNQTARASNLLLNQPKRLWHQFDQGLYNLRDRAGLAAGPPPPPPTTPGLRTVEHWLGNQQVRLADHRAAADDVQRLMRQAAQRPQPLTTPSGPSWLNPVAPVRETGGALLNPFGAVGGALNRANPFSGAHRPTPGPNALGVGTSGGLFARLGTYVQNRGTELGHWYQHTPDGLRANPLMIATAPLQPRSLAKILATNNGIQDLRNHLNGVTPPSPAAAIPSVTRTSGASPQATTADRQTELATAFYDTVDSLMQSGLPQQQAVDQAVQAVQENLSASDLVLLHQALTTQANLTQ